MPDRYQITTYHGESRSLWYIVDTYAPEDEQPAVRCTCFTEEDALQGLEDYRQMESNTRAMLERLQRDFAR